jgi:hypothetical protein
MVTQLHQLLIQVKLVAQVNGFLFSNVLCGLDRVEHLLIFLVNFSELSVQQMGIQLILLSQLFESRCHFVLLLGGGIVHLREVFIQVVFSINELFLIGLWLGDFLCLVFGVALEKQLTVGVAAFNLLVRFASLSKHPIILPILRELAKIIRIEILLVRVVEATALMPLLELLQPFDLLFAAHLVW